MKPSIISKFTSSENTARPIKRSDFHNAIIQYEISRFEVENLLTERLVHDLRSTPDNPMIQAGPGRCVFLVSGYDEEQRELFEIPEFVAFVRKVNESSPCWIYFSHPGFPEVPASRWLSLIAFCSINNVVVVRQAGIEKIHFACLEAEIEEFVDRQIRDFNAMCSLAKVRRKAIKKRLSEIRQCLGIRDRKNPQKMRESNAQ